MVLLVVGLTLGFGLGTGFGMWLKWKLDKWLAGGTVTEWEMEDGHV